MSKNRIKKTVSFEEDTFAFIEGYAKSLGNETFAAANERLVTIGAQNLEAMEVMTEKIVGAIQALDLKITHLEEKMKKGENRLAALTVESIKANGSTKHFTKLIFENIERNKLGKRENIKAEEVEEKLKFIIRSEENTAINKVMAELNKSSKKEEVNEYELH
jgi:hypothetical protein